MIVFPNPKIPEFVNASTIALKEVIESDNSNSKVMIPFSSVFETAFL
jgi:hypothetical protein